MKSTLRNTVLILGLLCLLFSFSAFARDFDLSRFVGQFQLVQGGSGCPSALDLQNTGNANQLAFQIYEAAKLEIPGRYKAKAYVRTNEIGQTLRSSGKVLKLTWSLESSGMALALEAGHLEFVPGGPTFGFPRDLPNYEYVKDSLTQCLYERM